MRQDQFQVSIDVDNRNLGIWMGREGGMPDSEETRVRPGGGLPEISLGGRATISNITATKLYTAVDGREVYEWLRTRVGKGQTVVLQQPLDADGNAFGQPLLWTGTLKSVTPPPHDANANDPATVEVEIVPNAQS